MRHTGVVTPPRRRREARTLRALVTRLIVIGLVLLSAQVSFFSSRRRHTRLQGDWSSDVCSSDLAALGYVTEAKLLRAYVGAAAFVYPSLEEGFGLPVLEAMQAGTPVITSNCSCLPEVAGGAAELVDPMSTESIATAIENVLDWTESERQARIAHGKERANQFSWS